MELTIYTDGGSRNNPGKAAIGIIILGKERVEYKEYIGIKTNNQAEYHAVIKALEIAKEMKAKKLNFFLDSQLVVNQLLCKFQVSNADIKILYNKVRALENNFESITYTHVKRENPNIQEADKLVNQALDQNQ